MPTDVGALQLPPGLAWSVTKAPTFQTRIQRAVSGRELRALDYPYPLWQFSLPIEFMRQNASFSELNALMGFFMVCQGAFSTFVYEDPTDNTVIGGLQPEATSTIVAIAISSGGSGYVPGDLVDVPGSATGAIYQVSTVGGGGAITGLAGTNTGGGSYFTVPGSTGVALGGGSGSGATVNITWFTTLQLVRILGGFTEPILIPLTISNIYYNGVPQSGWVYASSVGLVTLAAPFTSTQPAITADFTFAFRCRFVDDSYPFENFMSGFWSLKKLTFISVRP